MEPEPPCVGSSESQSLDHQGSPCPGALCSRSPRGHVLLVIGPGPRPREALLGLPTPLPSPLLPHFCAFFTAGKSYLLAFLWRVVPTRTAAGLARPVQGHTPCRLLAQGSRKAGAQQTFTDPKRAGGRGELGTAGLLTGCSLLYALIPHSASSFLGPLFFFLH